MEEGRRREAGGKVVAGRRAGEGEGEWEWEWEWEGKGRGGTKDVGSHEASLLRVHLPQLPSLRQHRARSRSRPRRQAPDRPHALRITRRRSARQSTKN